jgi:uncharacterized protein
MGSALLAYSGGVDSTFLLMAAKKTGIKIKAVTSYSATMAEKNFISACDLAQFLGVEHSIIETEEMNNPDFIKNNKDRCFFCKDELFSKLCRIASNEGYDFVIDGSNADDSKDWRPGMKAAIKHGVRSPLLEAELTKEEIRILSKEMGLPTWSKPSSPCLSSRFPYGTVITREALKKVEMAEDFLEELGFIELRVRYHGDLAKIELGKDEIKRMFDEKTRDEVIRNFKKIGFKYISLDLEGFKSGRLNP